MVVGAATWFYFLTQPTKQMVYVPLVLIGVSSSAMNVMALSLIVDVIKDDKVRMTSYDTSPPSLPYLHALADIHATTHPSFFNRQNELYNPTDV